MKEKTQVLLKILFIICMTLVILVFKVIPEYKESQGSSDTYINTDYEGIIELKIDSGVNFLFVTNNSNLTNILFLDNKSLCLYNKDIENTPLPTATEKIITLLIENNYLNQTSAITLIKYKNPSYQTFKNSLETSLIEKNFSCNIKELEMTLQEKAQVLNISTSDDEIVLLKEIELFSKDLIRHYKNNSSYMKTPEKDIITKGKAQEYAKNVYEKITLYAQINNITNQDINSTSMPINLIPVNKTGTIYPSPKSWYYIKDSKVYAYINITQESENYDFCYQGTLDKYKEGSCQ